MSTDSGEEMVLDHQREQKSLKIRKRRFDGKRIGEEKSLNQIYYRGLEIALLSENMEQCHPFVFCKDYLQDIMWGSLNRNNVKIYGMRWKPREHPDPSYAPLKLVLRINPKKIGGENKLRFQVGCVVHMLRMAESKMGFKSRSTAGAITPEDDKKDDKYSYFILKSPGEWAIAPPMISMWALLIRISLFFHHTSYSINKTINMISKEGKSICSRVLKKTSSQNKNDVSYIRTAKPGIKYLLKHGVDAFSPDMLKNYPAKSSPSQMHSLGIVTFSKYIQMSSINKTSYSGLFHTWGIA